MTICEQCLIHCTISPTLPNKCQNKFHRESDIFLEHLVFPGKCQKSEEGTFIKEKDVVGYQCLRKKIGPGRGLSGDLQLKWAPELPKLGLRGLYFLGLLHITMDGPWREV